MDTESGALSGQTIEPKDLSPIFDLNTRPEQAYVLSSQIRKAMGLSETSEDERRLGLSDAALEILVHANTRGRAMSILESLFPNNDIDDFQDAIAGAGHHQGKYEPPAPKRPYQHATLRGR